MAFTRRSFFKLAASATSAAIAVDGVFIEPNHPQLVEVTLPLKRLPSAWDGLRVVQLSDFHYDPYFSVVPIRKAIEITNRLAPDMIVLTGDFISSPISHHNRKAAAAAIEPCADLLASLRAKIGVWACLGNHDGATDPVRIQAVLQQRNITVLRNQSLALEREGERLWLAGVDDVLEGAADLEGTLQKPSRGEFILLLAHEPDFATQVKRFPVDVQLSGHSHGGQVRIPLVGAPVLPELGVKYSKGLYKVGNLTLYTNVGLGTVNLPVRLYCPPEITLFTLRSSPGNPGASS